MRKHVIAPADELPDGGRIIAQVGEREVAILRVKGELYAYVNWCAHQAGPICEGNLTGRLTANYDRESRMTTLNWEKEGEVLICPWHGWEYDVLTGECYSKKGISLPRYDVEIEDGNIVVSM